MTEDSELIMALLCRDRTLILMELDGDFHFFSTEWMRPHLSRVNAEIARRIPQQGAES